MIKWDWYQGTVPRGEPEEVAALVLGEFPMSDLAPGRPKNGYTDGAEVRRGDRVLAEIWWGGNPGVHVKGTGEDAPAVRRALERCGEHLPSRVDAAQDWVEAGFFDRVTRGLMAYAVENGIAIGQQGDWVRGQGRTLYLGSKSSAVRLVVYEKGYQAGGDLNWVRLEARVRPQKHAKPMVSTWGPEQAFRASTWLCEALAAIGYDALQPYAVGTVWRPSDAERARRALIAQYGATIAQWAEDVGGWDHFMPVLAEQCTGA